MFYVNLNIIRTIHKKASIAIIDLITKNYKFYEVKVNLSFYNKKVIEIVSRLKSLD